MKAVRVMRNGDYETDDDDVMMMRRCGNSGEEGSSAANTLKGVDHRYCDTAISHVLYVLRDPAMPSLFGDHEAIAIAPAPLLSFLFFYELQ